jgi:hypothetical protein
MGNGNPNLLPIAHSLFPEVSVFTTIVRKIFLAKKDIPASKKIVVLLNIKHRDGNYTPLKDKLP